MQRVNLHHFSRYQRCITPALQRPNTVTNLRFQGQTSSLPPVDAAFIQREIAPAVVRILTPYGTGSGFLYQPRESERPRLITAAHVLTQIAETEELGQPAQVFLIQLQDDAWLRVCLAKSPEGKLSFDPGSDIAVLDILSPLPDGVKPLRFRDFRGDPPRRTEEVFMIGRSTRRPSMQLTHSLSQGSILSDFVMIETGFSPMNYGKERAGMKTSLQSFPGDSGSPVFDRDGLIVGVLVRDGGTLMRGEQVLTSLFQMAQGPAELVKRDKPLKRTLRQRISRAFRKGS